MMSWPASTMTMPLSILIVRVAFLPRRKRRWRSSVALSAAACFGSTFGAAGAAGFCGAGAAFGGSGLAAGAAGAGAAFGGSGLAAGVGVGAGLASAFGASGAFGGSGFAAGAAGTAGAGAAAAFSA